MIPWTSFEKETIRLHARCEMRSRYKLTVIDNFFLPFLTAITYLSIQSVRIVVIVVGLLSLVEIFVISNRPPVAGWCMASVMVPHAEHNLIWVSRSIKFKLEGFMLKMKLDLRLGNG